MHKNLIWIHRNCGSMHRTWVCLRQCLSAERNWGKKSPPLAQTLSPIDNYSQTKRSSRQQSHWGYKLVWSAAPLSRSRWLTKNELKGIFGKSFVYTVKRTLYFWFFCLFACLLLVFTLPVICAYITTSDSLV